MGRGDKQDRADECDREDNANLAQWTLPKEPGTRLLHGGFY